jgi:hypothetical protein
MAAASRLGYLGWQSIGPEAADKAEPRLHKYRLPISGDLDVGGDQIIFLGVTKAYPFAPEGGIVWTGSFAKKLADLRPILNDKAGPGAQAFSNCGSSEVGAVRILTDGSMLAVPGSQPGVCQATPTFTS